MNPKIRRSQTYLMTHEQHPGAWLMAHAITARISLARTQTENRWPCILAWCIVAFVSENINHQAVCLCVTV